jgi:Secretion system C-terminal sorting domain
VEQLRNMGYDVVIVNYNNFGTDFVTKTMYVSTMGLNIPYVVTYPTKIIDGGTDFIERNAQTLIQVIKDVNKELIANNASPEKSVLMGPSMGGQICRYALRWMEQQENLGVANMDHNCRLYISFDSPHTGANIDFGLQESIRFLGDNLEKESARDFLNKQIRTPGAREMLISQIAEPYDPPSWYNFTQLMQYNNNYRITQGNFFQGNSPMHINYYNDINSMGLPIKCRNIAASNGSYSGGEYHAEASQMFHYRMVKNKWPHTQLLDLKAYYVSAKNVEYIANIQVAGKPNELFEDKFASPIGALDAAPGGIYDMQQDLYDQLPLGVQKNVAKILGINVDGDAKLMASTNLSCFIPTFSGLGIINNQIDWRTPISINNLYCGQNTIFDNVYAPSSNEGHTMLNIDNVRWFLTEIDKGHKGVDCLPSACALNIVGTDMCKGGSQVFSLNTVLPTNTKVTWTIASTTLQVINGGTPLQQVTCKDISTNLSDYAFTISAEIENPCGENIHLSKRIYVHAPLSLKDFKIINNPFMCNNDYHVVYKWGNIPTDVTASWSKNGSAFGMPLNVNTSHGVSGGCVNSTDEAYASLNDGCGFLGTIYLKVPPAFNTQCSCKKENSIADFSQFKVDVYPNPTLENWNIMLYNFTYTINTSCVLYDINGKEVWQANKSDLSNSNILVPAKHLTKGIYTLKIISDSNTLVQKLIKE